MSLKQQANEYLWFIVHVQLKGLQIGSVLGTLGGLAFHKVRPTSVPYAQNVGKVALLGGIGGFLLCTAVVLYKMKNFTHDEITDRSFRLSHNYQQQTMDLFSAIGALGFMGLNQYSNAFGNSARGAAVGVAFGSLCYGIMKLAGKNYTIRIFSDE